MKLKSLIGIGLALILTACSNPSQENNTETTPQEQGSSDQKVSEKLVVGATSVPHAEILNEIKSDLAEQGIELEVKEFSDYSLLNPALNDGQIDANFFQHTPYLEEYLANSKQNLVSIGSVHNEPMGIYSSKIKSLDELSDGAKVGIPNDVPNGARALLLLENKGLIKLKEGAGSSASENDIIENSKNLEFMPIKAAQLPRTLSEVEISVINTNYALEGGLDPLKDALEMEDKDSPYANIIVVKSGDENKESIQKLYKAATSEKVKKFIEDKYKGAIVPSF